MPAPLPVALVVLDAHDFPDTDAARHFVLSPRFARFLGLAEHGLYLYRSDGDGGPAADLVRHAAVHLLLDLKFLQRMAGSAMTRRLEPRPLVSESADAVVWTRAVLAELATKLADDEAAGYLLGLFERVRTPAGPLRAAPPAASSPRATRSRAG
jgi:hypothetical protein